MRSNVLETVRRFRMISPGDRIGVACSGGPDSTALLLVLAELASELGCTLSVAHFNHRLRGAESDGDEQFVGSLAAKLGVPLHSAASDVSAKARSDRANLEGTARRLRYRYFFSLVESGAVDRIAAGHTMDDQAETVLHRFVRGAGNRGLGGIHPTIGKPPSAEKWLIRPLLEVRRQVVREYLQSRKQNWREDSSNQNQRFTRNRIRHRLLPALEELNPSVVETLARSAEIARDEEGFWDSYIEALGESALRREGGRLQIDIASLRAMHAATARRLLRRAIQEAVGAGDQQAFPGCEAGWADFGHVQRLLALALEGQSGTGLCLPRGIRARKEFSTLVLKCQAEATASIRSSASGSSYPGYCYKVREPQTLSVPEIGSSFVFELIPLASGVPRYNGNREELLDRRVIQDSLLLRNWRAGDAYRQKGHRKARKIKELFQRGRVPEPERLRWPVVVAGDQIVWCRRWGIAEGFGPRPGSTEALRIREILDHIRE